MSQPKATLLMTRPMDASLAFIDQYGSVLRDQVQVVISPLLEIVATGQVPDLAGVKGVIFTSTNGVLFGGPGQDIPAYCVGSATTEQARLAGWKATCRGDGSKAIIQSLTSDKPAVPLLHIGGVHRRGNVAGHLSDAGVTTTESEVYDQALLSLNDDAKNVLSGEHPVIVPLFSPRTARQFAREHAGTAPLHLIALSDAISVEADSLAAVSRTVCPSADAASMMTTLRNVLHRVETGGPAQ